MKTQKIGIKLLNKLDDLPQSGEPRAMLSTKPDTIELTQKNTPLKSISALYKQIFAKKKSNLTKDIVSQLETQPLNKFYDDAKHIAQKSYGIPDNLKVDMFYNKNLSPREYMIFDWGKNIIYINPRCDKLDRSTLFSFIKHEITHQKQMYDGLRTKGLGDEIIETLTSIEGKGNIENFKNTIKNLSATQLKELKPHLPEQTYNYAEKYLEAIKKGEDAEKKFLEELLQIEINTLKTSFKGLQKRIIESMGELPADSDQGRFARNCFQSLINSQKNRAGIKTAFTTEHEIEANCATFIALGEYLLAKLGFLK